MKAIVTGANGFVGSHVVNQLVEHGIEVLAIDLSFSTSRLDKDYRIKKIEMSIENISEILNYTRDEDYDLFYHFAWIGSSGPLRTDEMVQTKNALWTVDCLRTASKLGCKKFICAGSIMEYEVISNTYEQGINPSSSNIYSAAKSYAHELSKPIANELGIELCWAYITNAYGVGEKSPRFINSTLRKIIHKEKLEFTSGIQNYDFVYIDDVAKAFYLIGLYGKANKGYMIGSGNAQPLKNFVIEMCNCFSDAGVPHFGEIPFTGVNLPIETYSILDLEKDCNYKCEISFKDGIKKTKEWLENIEE